MLSAQRSKTDLRQRFSPRELAFLGSLRWIGLTLIIILIIPLFLRLSLWQFHRLDARRAANSAVTAGLAIAPIPLPNDTSGTSIGSHPLREWQPVTLTGSWVPGTTILARKHWRGDSIGFYIVDAFTTDAGIVVPVVRGWMSPVTQAGIAPRVLRPPHGQVTVHGWIREMEKGVAQSGLPAKQIQWINAEAFAIWPSTGVGSATMASVWVQSDQSRNQLNVLWETKAHSSIDDTSAPTVGAATAPAGVFDIPSPELSEGWHLSYAWQWRTFALLALVGWMILVRTELLRRREAQSVDSAVS